MNSGAYLFSVPHIKRILKGIGMDDSNLYYILRNNLLWKKERRSYCYRR
jgi:hypothetical protein